MSFLTRSIGKLVAGTAMLVALLAAMMAGPLGSASAAQQVCSFDKKALEPVLGFWRAAAEEQEALLTEPLPPIEYEALRGSYVEREWDDSPFVEGWGNETSWDLLDAWDRAVGRARADYQRARRGLAKRANDWLRRNKARLGEDRALKMAWAMYRRGVKPLRKRRDARIEKARTVCPRAMRQAESIGRSGVEELGRNYRRTIAALEERLDLWWEENPDGYPPG